jgi:hypothetical protein
MLKRYVYWLCEDEVEGLSNTLLLRRQRLTPIKGVPCKGLHPDVEIGSVAPAEWNRVCRRQGGWYRESRRFGSYLVVTDEQNRLSDREADYVIEPSDFEPDNLPDEAEVVELARADAFTQRAPSDWHDITDRDRKYWRRMLAKVNAVGELDDLLEFHSANQANFLQPRFFVREGDDDVPAPYSIGPTAKVCSACVELFGLLGTDHRTQYVMPCPGLVLSTGISADRYLRVSRLGKRR